jgi:hypothetical protein
LTKRLASFRPFNEASRYVNDSPLQKLERSIEERQQCTNRRIHPMRKRLWLFAAGLCLVAACPAGAQVTGGVLCMTQCEMS